LSMKRQEKRRKRAKFYAWQQSKRAKAMLAEARTVRLVTAQLMGVKPYEAGEIKGHIFFPATEAELKKHRWHR